MEQRQKLGISNVQEESLNRQSQTTSPFAELHQILTEKEQRLLGDIREEEEKIVKRMETNLQAIQENLNSIQDELLMLQGQIDHKDNMIFLKEEAGRKSRFRDEAKPMLVVHGSWPIEKFDPSFFNMALREASDIIKRVSVTLDVETAHPELEVFEDRKRVRRIRTQRCLPDTGKRFISSPCVLGSEGFTWGRHYWEVEVAGNQYWSVGVATEFVERKRGVKLTPETGVWSIGRQADMFVIFNSPPSPLPVRLIPGRLGVYLSYESGTDTHIIPCFSRNLSPRYIMSESLLLPALVHRFNASSPSQPVSNQLSRSPARAPTLPFTFSPSLSLSEKTRVNKVHSKPADTIGYLV
ncbi:E3 ubiquitin-protein ligase TRIM39-like [Amblyraja radiata]|uniref:E3 ubiquitin-protein ligase TRIM39-like n=1 Tax=Amblyraja radiata TaxID=386614 RepID=UPI0014032CAB|nr:E3 ubiquitin-protein ligase TRIM39-like [Amblyraja radiata]